MSYWLEKLKKPSQDTGHCHCCLLHAPTRQQVLTAQDIPEPDFRIWRPVHPCWQVFMVLKGVLQDSGRDCHQHSFWALPLACQHHQHMRQDGPTKATVLQWLWGQPIISWLGFRSSQQERACVWYCKARQQTNKPTVKGLEDCSGGKTFTIQTCWHESTPLKPYNPCPGEEEKTGRFLGISGQLAKFTWQVSGQWDTLSQNKGSQFLRNNTWGCPSSFNILVFTPRPTHTPSKTTTKLVYLRK